MIHKRLVYVADDRRLRWKELRDDGVWDRWIRCPFETMPGHYCFVDCAAIALETEDGFDRLICRARGNDLKFVLGSLDPFSDFDLHRALTWGSDMEKAERDGKR